MGTAVIAAHPELAQPPRRPRPDPRPGEWRGGGVGAVQCGHVEAVGADQEESRPHDLEQRQRAAERARQLHDPFGHDPTAGATHATRDRHADCAEARPRSLTIPYRSSARRSRLRTAENSRSGRYYFCRPTARSSRYGGPSLRWVSVVLDSSLRMPHDHGDRCARHDRSA